jgi:hypothetical protein
MICALIKEDEVCNKLPLSKIGRIINRKHCTVIHLLKAHSSLNEMDKDYKYNFFILKKNKAIAELINVKKRKLIDKYLNEININEATNNSIMQCISAMLDEALTNKICSELNEV